MRASSPRRKVEEVEESVTPLDVFHTITYYTSPDFSLPFIIFFILITYFHETHTTPTGIFVGIWFIIQLASFVIKKDFRNDLFWSIFGLIGNLIFYLIIGYFWSLAKLYLDIWQGHLDADLTLKIRECVKSEDSCVFTLLAEMKWFIVQWMLTWPVSIAYTISRDPFKVLTDFIFEISKRRYFYIINSAISAHDGNIGEASPLYILLFIFLYIFVGYVWSHLKLFIDVWQSALPHSLEKELKERNYFIFVISIKWLVLQWIITWPFSIIYTILRHPVRIIADFIYKLSQKKYAWIVAKAIESR